jgi:hypothetical protein
MAQHKLEYWYATGDAKYEIFDDEATCRARFIELQNPPDRAWGSNVYHMNDNGDWQFGFEA